MNLTYNEQEAKKAGGGDYVTDGGAYVCEIIEARYVEAKTKTKGIEFSVQTREGQKANYLTAYYEKADGTAISGGMSLLQAMMGILQIPSTSFQEVRANNEVYSIVPEFTNKVIGLFLQKVLYTKNNGSEGYKFEIRVPFDAQSAKTLKEKVDGKDAKLIPLLTEKYADKDDRGNSNGSNQSAPPQAPAMDQFDDDIPF